MLIYRYLAQRYALFIGVICFFLAFIFNFIEFFEKLLSVKRISIQTIIHFLFLNFAPTMFDLVPIALWLATVILLKELTQRNEWELLQVLTFAPKKFTAFLLVMGLTVSSLAFISHEVVIGELALRAGVFKQERFKQSKGHVVVDRWLELEDNKLCRVGYCDLASGSAYNLVVMEFCSSRKVQKIIKARHVDLDEAAARVDCDQALVFDQQARVRRCEQPYHLYSPAFFSQVRLATEAKTLLQSGKKLMNRGPFLPPAASQDLWADVIARVCFYLQLLLYPLCTFFLFVSFHGSLVPWIGALMTYPFFVLLGVVGDYLIKSGFPALAVLAPYVFIVFLLIFRSMRVSRL